MHPALFKLLMLSTKAALRRTLRGTKTVRGAFLLLFALGFFALTGNALVGQHLFERGARRMTITFDPGYTSCTLSVVNGKAKGSDTIMIVSSTTGKRLEVVSSTIGSTSCSIKDGNVFGAQ